MLSEVQRQNNEFMAWQEVVRAWQTITYEDINNSSNDYVVKTIQHWGEMLVQLRIEQDEEVRSSAAAESYKRMVLARDEHYA